MKKKTKSTIYNIFYNFREASHISDATFATKLGFEVAYSSNKVLS